MYIVERKDLDDNSLDKRECESKSALTIKAMINEFEIINKYVG